MRSFILAALVPAALSAQVAQSPARPITLAEAIDLAKRNSPQTIAARNNINANEATVRTRLSAFLPTFSGSMSSGWAAGQVFNTSGDIVSRNSDALELEPEALGKLVAVRWWRPELPAPGGPGNVAASEANEVAARFSVAYSVSQQYYAALAARKPVRGGTALAEAQQNLRAANARIAAGAATRSDSLRSVIAVGNQQLAVLSAENDLQNANAALTRLVGTPFTVTAAEADTALARSQRIARKWRNSWRPRPRFGQRKPASGRPARA
jgi:outer membrane protein TolC